MKIFLYFLISTIVFYLLSKLFELLSYKVYQRGHEILEFMLSSLDSLFSSAFVIFTYGWLVLFTFLLVGTLL